MQRRLENITKPEVSKCNCFVTPIQIKPKIVISVHTICNFKWITVNYGPIINYESKIQVDTEEVVTGANISLNDLTAVEYKRNWN